MRQLWAREQIQLEWLQHDRILYSTQCDDTDRWAGFLKIWWMNLILFCDFRLAGHFDCGDFRFHPCSCGAIELLWQGFAKFCGENLGRPLQILSAFENTSDSHDFLDETQLAHFISAVKTRSPWTAVYSSYPYIDYAWRCSWSLRLVQFCSAIQ